MWCACENINSKLFTASPCQSCSLGKPFDIVCYVDYNNFSVKHRSFLATVTKGQEPHCFQEAVKHPGWRKAMEDSRPLIAMVLRVRRIYLQVRKPLVVVGCIVFNTLQLARLNG